MKWLIFLMQICQDLIYYSLQTLLRKILCLISISNHEQEIEVTQQQIKRKCLEIIKRRKLEKNLKISIIIPSYNEEIHLSETIERILHNDHRMDEGSHREDLEIIISDGGSRDRTLEIIQKFRLKYQKIVKFVTGSGSVCLSLILSRR
jgi:hypothetical protein